jgi:hypothetical protein
MTADKELLLISGRAGLIGEYNGLCSSGDGWNMVWTDTREGNQDTYTAPVREGSATPTPQPDPELGLNIILSQLCFEPGDSFILQIYLYNEPGTFYQDIPLFVMIDLYGQYNWWPGWTEEIQYRLIDFDSTGDMVNILNFVWPDNAGTGSNVRIHAALTDPEITQLLSEDSYDSQAFAWNHKGDCD